MLEVTSIEHYDSLIANFDKVILFYHAPWCSSCRAMEPLLEDLVQREYGDIVTLVDIDVDKFPEIANAAHVSSLPTIKYVEGSKVLYTHTGVISMYDLDHAIKGCGSV
jgi:thioredoxin 1